MHYTPLVPDADRNNQLETIITALNRGRSNSYPGNLGIDHLHHTKHASDGRLLGEYNVVQRGPLILVLPVTLYTASVHLYQAYVAVPGETAKLVAVRDAQPRERHGAIPVLETGQLIEVTSEDGPWVAVAHAAFDELERRAVAWDAEWRQRKQADAQARTAGRELDLGLAAAQFA